METNTKTQLARFHTRGHTARDFDECSATEDLAYRIEQLRRTIRHQTWEYQTTPGLVTMAKRLFGYEEALATRYRDEPLPAGYSVNRLMSERLYAAARDLEMGHAVSPAHDIDLATREAVVFRQAESVLQACERAEKDRVADTDTLRIIRTLLDSCADQLTPARAARFAALAARIAKNLERA